MEGTAVSVNDEAVAGCIGELLKASDMGSVSRPLNEKPGVNGVDGDTLTTLEGMTRICSILSSLA
jgi:hypothetical protein